MQKGARVADDQQLQNILFLRAHVNALTTLLAHQSIETIWLTFPDPFPKQRSAKHRLTHPQFLKIYQQLLKPTGSLCFKTDSLALFQWSLEQFVKQGWRIEDLSFDLHESELDAAYKQLTTYESRFVNEGLAINFVRLSPPAL